MGLRACPARLIRSAQARRDAKRATKAAFGAERKRQKTTEARQVALGASDVRGASATTAGTKVVRL